MVIIACIEGPVIIEKILAYLDAKVAEAEAPQAAVIGANSEP